MSDVTTKHCGSKRIHDGHRWEAGQWRRREKWCHGTQEPPERWEAKAYRQADDLLRQVWDLHGTPVTNDRPGFGGVGRSFYCNHCRMPWPCETARLVINWGELTERDYEPLRLVERLPAEETR